MEEEVRRMTDIIMGNTFDTLSKESYKELESLAFFVGHDSRILNANLPDTNPNYGNPDQLVGQYFECDECGRTWSRRHDGCPRCNRD